jgi:hypothetical protein
MDGSTFSISSFPSNFWPHSLQNLLADAFTFPHFAQVISSLLPQWLQNLAPSGLTNWHFGHFTSALLNILFVSAFAAREISSSLRKIT